MSGLSPQFDFNLKSENRNPGVIIIMLRIKLEIILPTKYLKSDNPVKIILSFIPDDFSNPSNPIGNNVT